MAGTENESDIDLISTTVKEALDAISIVRDDSLSPEKQIEEMYRQVNRVFRIIVLNIRSAHP